MDGNEVQANGDSLEEQAVYTLSSELSYSSRTLACVAFLKRPSPITSDLPVAKQLSVVNLPLSGILGNSADSGSSLSPYESLHSLLRGAIAPFFEAAARGLEPSSDKRRADGDSRMGVTGARRRLAELDSSLLNLLQNSEVQSPRLQIHEAVLKQLEESQNDVGEAIAQIPDNILHNSGILNKLQAMANDWIRQIREFTKQADERPVGSATQEKNFWLATESAIDSIEEQLAGPGVQLTMRILEKAKRHSVTASFQSDTGLKEAKDRVQRYNQLFHGFPIEEVLNATSVEKLQEALNQVFTHLNKKLRICPYPIKRALPLVEAISADLDARIHKLIHGRSLMQMSFEDFQKIIVSVNNLWECWDENIKEFTNVAREVTRRRNDKFIPIKIQKKHDKTQDRLEFIDTFRTNHEQLQRTIGNVLGPEDDGADTQRGGDPGPEDRDGQHRQSGQDDRGAAG